MRFVLQILFLLLTWLITFANATPPAQKLTIPNYSLSLPTTENQKLASEVKIGVEHYARSGISGKIGSPFLNSSSQKGVLQESCVVEGTRARVSEDVVNGAGIGTKIDNFVTEIAKLNLPPSVASTFENSVYKTVTTNQGVTLNRAFGNQAYLKGGFATTKVNATRSELALLDEWNNSMRFEATIEVPAGQTLNIGKVAPQTSSNGLQTLAGGGDQILMPQNWNYQSWVTKVTDKTTGIEYTYNQFQTAFPNMITP